MSLTQSKTSGSTGIRLIDHKKMGHGKQVGVVESYFHFSFDWYYNPKNMQFGTLRVVNDDEVKPGTGFDLHPHANMEIISYVVEGELTHQDSMGNARTLKRGQVQYMSAGTGVWHSEHNRGTSKLRFLQIWILPDKKGYQPNYGDVPFAFEDRVDCWFPIASGSKSEGSKAPIRLHQDMNIYAMELSKGKMSKMTIEKGRQAYVILIEGKIKINGEELEERDALEAVEKSLDFEANGDRAHLLVLEMAKST